MHDQARAVQQSAPDLEGRRVEGERSELQQSVRVAERHVARVTHQPHDVAVGDAYALGNAGRSRGEHHIRIALCAGGLEAGVFHIARREPEALDRLRRQPCLLKLRQRRYRSQDRLHIRSPHQFAGACDGIARIERNIHCPRPEHGKQGDDGADRSLEVQPDTCARPYALLHHLRGELTRRLRKLPVGESRGMQQLMRGIDAFDGHGIGMRRRHGVEQLRHARLPRVRSRMCAPLVQLLQLLLRQHRHATHRLFRIANGVFGKHLQMLCNPRNRSLIEERGAVLEYTADFSLVVPQEQRDVVHRRRARDVEFRREGRVLQYEGHLEYRRPRHGTRGPERLHELLERQITVSLRFEHVLARFADELADAGRHSDRP